MSDSAAKPTKDDGGVSELFDVSCTARSTRGLITATVDSGGYPSDIQINERAMRLTPAAMREELLSALRNAHGAVRERLQERLRDVAGEGGATAHAATEQTWRAADEVRQSAARVTDQFEEVRRRLFGVLDGP